MIPKVLLYNNLFRCNPRGHSYAHYDMIYLGYISVVGETGYEAY
jgi:hypothetical protein